MGEFALLDGDGNVTNVIVAEQEFIDSLPDLVADDSVDTGDLPAGASSYRDITDLDPKPGIGWRRAGNGVFVAPTPPEPTAEEVEAAEAAEAARAQRADDDEFLDAMAAKIDSGESLTQDERDRVAVIQTRRA